MKLSFYHFDVPKKLIAKYPPTKRDEARLMVVNRKKQSITHHSFKEFSSFFKSGDVIVKNNSQVSRWVLYGHKEKNLSKIKVFLLRELKGERHLWDSMIEPARKIRTGNKLFFGDLPLVAEVIDNTTSRGRTIKFSFEGSASELKALISEIGAPPIPELLDRSPEEIDFTRYQSVFSKKPGAVVVPDGSLFFTPHMLKFLELKDVQLPELTLYTNPETLLPLNIQDLGRYLIGSEHYEIEKNVANLINEAKANKKQVCAVGCGTFKAMESSLSSENKLLAKEDWSGQFIYPPYKPKIATALLTNFHLPGSPPVLNALAFGSAAGGATDLIMRAYKEAIKEQYKFFVYGDALLIL